MTLELLGSTASPFVRKVRVMMAEAEITDIPFVPTVASPMGGEDAINAANPLGKIPALRRADAPTIFDSRVITRFLDHRAGSGLYPEARLWDTLTLEAMADGIMEAAAGIVYENRHRPAELQFLPWQDAQWTKVTRTLDSLERQWMSHLYGPVDMAQIAIGCALGYLDFRHAARNWRDGRDALAAWEKTFAARPAMIETAPA